MWNLLNRKWVPIFSMVLSILMITLSIYIYMNDFGRNFLNNCGLQNDSVNIICISVSTIFLIMFVTSMNLLIVKNYLQNNKFILNNSSNTHNSSIFPTLTDIQVDYSFDNEILIIKYGSNCLPISIDALRQIVELNKYVHEEDISIFNELLLAIKNKQENFSFDIRAKLHSNSYEKYRINSSLLTNDSMSSQGLSITLNKLTQSENNSINTVINKRDSLTSLYDFSTFRQFVTNILSNNRPLNKKNYILIITIDDFDILIDTYGKDFSNILLICFANQLSRILSKDDLASYIYDNKFMLFINDEITINNIEQVCKCTKNIFSTMYFEHNIPSISCCIDTIFIDGINEINFDDLLNGTDINIERIKPLYNLPLIDNSRIIYSILNLFNDSKNLQMSLNTALNLIGYIYNLDMINLYELNDYDDSIKANFAWYSDSFIKHSSLIDNVKKEQYENFMLCDSVTNNIFSTDSFNQLDLQASVFKYAFYDANCNNIYQRKITSNDKFNGFLLAASSNKYSNWNNDICNSLTLLTSIITNNLEKLRTQQSIQKLIKLDNLTGANNLKSFSNIVENTLKHNTNKKFVMIYFDVDRFTLMNDTYGYNTGDFVLKKISYTLENILLPHESFCRIVDDKFIVCAEYTTLENVRIRMHEFSKTLKTITDNKDNTLKITLTAGLSLIDNIHNISQIIDEANTARRSVKHKHNSNYAFFNDSMKNRQLKAKSLEDVMEDALLNHEFCLYLQPKYNVIEQKVCGAEALVRWNRPGKGIIPPNEFIPIFEENSFIIEVDYYIFDRVCELIRSLLDQGKTPVPISVNFSRLHLNNTKILDKLKNNLKKYNLTPEYIEIEITESAFAESDVYMNSILTEIHRLGFKLAMDDFGTGLSSLNSLRKLPFDILKLDKDFFQKDQITKRERIVISNIVRLGKELAMSIVSEGVETAEQIAFLKDIECPIIQGYFFSKPIHYNEFLSKYYS